MFRCPVIDCVNQYDILNSLAIHISRVHKTTYSKLTGTNWCPNCKVFKPLSEHYVSSVNASGVLKYCMDCHKELAKNKKDKVKREVFEHYGNKCNCCNESIYDFLTIDHINNDGSKHISKSGRRYKGDYLYHWLRRNSYPSGFQLLCYNCNCAKNYYKVCPHQLKSVDKVLNNLIEDLSNR
jgi:hypothetical protein